MELHLIAQSGNKTGLGHIKRCITLYQFLKSNTSLNLLFYIFSHDIINLNLDIRDYIYVHEEANFEILIKDLLNRERQILIFDLNEQEFSSKFTFYLKNLKPSQNTLMISIDSLLAYNNLIDYFFIPSFYYSEKLKNVDKKKLSFGWDHYLINNNFSPEIKNFKQKKLIILTGGSDISNLGEKLPVKIDEILDVKCDINWVVGPFAQSPKYYNINKHNWSFQKSLKSLDHLYQISNYAISVYGVSFFELMYYGIPTVVFSPYGKKDINELNQISKLGIAIVAIDYEDAVNKLNHLLNNDDHARSLSNKAKSIFSKNGSYKFLEILKKLIKNKWEMDL